jgi:flagellin-specific chaperone FliS
MAEIGLIASVIQVAGAGLKLSQTLYQYADSVASADRRIKDIAKEVELTSFVIDELGSIFKADDTSALLSKTALKTADETVKECANVFEELEKGLKKSAKGKMGKWLLPFKESKMETLRAHVDKLKSTLQLLMQVLTHAHQVDSQ